MLGGLGGYTMDVNVDATRLRLLVLIAALGIAAVIVAVVFDSPTAVWILAGIAVIASIASLLYGLRADRS